jgi:hypothetical protein
MRECSRSAVRSRSGVEGSFLRRFEIFLNIGDETIWSVERKKELASQKPTGMILNEK